MKINSRYSLKKTLVTGFLVAIATVTFLGSGVFIFSPPAFLTGNISQEHGIQEGLYGRHIIDFSERGDTVVVYSYRGEPMPEKLADDEDIKKRTSNSFTRSHGVNAQGEQTYTTVFYVADRFFQEDNKWYFIEYDQTSKDIFFNKYLRSNVIFRFFMESVYAADFFSGEGDGRIIASDSDNVAITAWNTAHNASSGTVAASSSPQTVGVQTGIIVLEPEFPNIYTASIYRMFLPFDTSTIPSGSKVSAAELNVFVETVSNDDPDANATLEVIQTSQSTHATLINTDYNNVGTTQGATGINLGSLTTGQYNTFTLNSTGLGWIATNGDLSNCSSAAGITCLGLREGHDLNNSPMNFPTSGNDSNTIGVSQSEAPSITQDPYLSVTYNSFAPWQFFPF